MQSNDIFKRMHLWSVLECLENDYKCMCVHVCKHTHTHIIHNSPVQHNFRYRNYFHQSFDPHKVSGLFSLKSSYTISKYFTHWIKAWYLKACIIKRSSTDFNSLPNLTSLIGHIMESHVGTEWFKKQYHCIPRFSVHFQETHKYI